MIITITIKILLILGTFFSLVSAIGVVRLPDILMRLQAVSKASTLGIAFVLVAVALYFQDTEVTVKCFFIISFLFLTSPICSHLIARSAYRSRVPLWKGTVCDRLRPEMEK
jgi:multicomponent Na+:H+ antiporter subunit G